MTTQVDRIAVHIDGRQKARIFVRFREEFTDQLEERVGAWAGLRYCDARRLHRAVCWSVRIKNPVTFVERTHGRNVTIFAEGHHGSHK